VFIPAVIGCAGILWARRRFGTAGAARGSGATVTAAETAVRRETCGEDLRA
jgi:hypothetical protein